MFTLIFLITVTSLFSLGVCIGYPKGFDRGYKEGYDAGYEHCELDTDLKQNVHR